MRQCVGQVSYPRWLTTDRLLEGEERSANRGLRIVRFLEMPEGEFLPGLAADGKLLVLLPGRQQAALIPNPSIRKARKRLFSRLIRLHSN